jgi:hypothetical protein
MPGMQTMDNSARVDDSAAFLPLLPENRSPDGKSRLGQKRPERPRLPGPRRKRGPRSPRTGGITLERRKRRHKIHFGSVASGMCGMAQRIRTTRLHRTRGRFDEDATYL